MSKSEEGPNKKVQTGTKGAPTLRRFLDFLTRQMAGQPEQIIAADATQLARIGKLVKGVNIT